jgi:hypothetical protein
MGMHIPKTRSRRRAFCGWASAATTVDGSTEAAYPYGANQEFAMNAAPSKRENDPMLGNIARFNVKSAP